MHPPPLMYACMNGWLDIVKMIAINKQNVDFQSVDGMNGLMLASYYRFFDIVKYLIEGYKAYTNLTDDIDQNVLHKACKSDFGNLEAVKYLIEEHNLYLETKDYFGNTPLMLAIKANNLEIVNYLISKGADVNTGDKRYSALQQACYMNKLGMAESLLKAGANPNTTDWEGKTPYDHVKGKNETIEKLLRSYMNKSTGEVVINQLETQSKQSIIIDLLKDAIDTSQENNVIKYLVSKLN